MPRKSNAAIETESLRLVRVARSKPPVHLSGPQAEVWLRVVETKPADWFRPDTFPLLEAYCHHAVTAKAIDEKIRLEGAGMETDEMDRLLKMRARESRVLMALGRSMRLTQQSQLKAETAHTQQQRTRGRSAPWTWNGKDAISQ